MFNRIQIKKLRRRDKKKEVKKYQPYLANLTSHFQKKLFISSELEALKAQFENMMSQIELMEVGPLIEANYGKSKFKPSVPTELYKRKDKKALKLWLFSI